VQKVLLAVYAEKGTDKEEQGAASGAGAAPVEPPQPQAPDGDVAENDLYPDGW
jgi:hypothetical protein